MILEGTIKSLLMLLQLLKTVLLRNECYSTNKLAYASDEPTLRFANEDG